MVLEASIVCLDNSDWMRNGDYPPTRLEAQNDAINIICGAKTGSNPENTVGIVAGAGRSPEVLVTLTTDLGKVLSSLHQVKIGGSVDFSRTLQVAQLALKHRQNKNQQQRIIVFIGSPISEDTNTLVSLGKKLKKNNVAVDVVNFGEANENTEKLEQFIEAVKSNDNSHLVTIPPGPHILSDILLSSAIITGSEGGPAPGGSDFANYGGVDPNLDPELALALKVSMEEERARQEAEAKKSETSAPETKETPMVDAEDEEMAQALAMSMQSTSTTTQQTEDVKMSDAEELTEEQEMQLALQMSVQSPATQKETQKPPEEDVDKVLEDPNFVNSVLMSLPGVDPNDDRIKSVLESFKQGEKKDDNKKQ